MKLANRLTALRTRVAAQGWRKTWEYVLVTALGERLGVEVEAVYRFGCTPSAVASGDPESAFEFVRSFEQLSAGDIEALGAYGGRELVEGFGRRLSQKQRCVVGRINGALAVVCWLVPRDEYSRALSTPVLVVESCFTLAAFRGRGLFPSALRYLSAEVLREQEVPETPVIVEVSISNEASIRGIVKAGCQRIGTNVRIGKRKILISPF